MEVKFVPLGGLYVVHVNEVLMGELYKEVDGFWVFWPDNSRVGFWSAWVLRSIADKMDELNEEWDQEVKRGLGKILTEHLKRQDIDPEWDTDPFSGDGV